MQQGLTELGRRVEHLGAIILSDAVRITFERRIRGALEARRLRGADAALVSFGKSGRTWLRVMLSHFYQIRYGLEEDMLIDFDNMHRRHRGIPKLFFTHDNYLGDWTGNGSSKADYATRPVVLLVRHPADTAVSQYHQWRHRMRPHKMLLNQYPPPGAELGIYEFIRGERGGLPRIVRFMNEWAAALPRLPRVLLVRYEDLHRDPSRELSRILSFLAAPEDAKAVQHAVDFAGFERMRARESCGAKVTGASGRLTAADSSNPDSFKTRRAQVDGWRGDINEDQACTIDEWLATHLDPMYGYCGTHRA